MRGTSQAVPAMMRGDGVWSVQNLPFGMDGSGGTPILQPSGVNPGNRTVKCDGGDAGHGAGLGGGATDAADGPIISASGVYKFAFDSCAAETGIKKSGKYLGSSHDFIHGTTARSTACPKSLSSGTVRMVRIRNV